jgi:ABC-type transporter Mla subunit MlaD
MATTHSPLSPVRLDLARLACLTVLVLAAGCGGGSDPQPQSAVEIWADDVCSSVADWKDAVEDAQSALSDPADLSATDVRDTLQGVADATNAFVTDLTGIGTPDTQAGQAAADELSTLSGRLRHHADIVSEAVGESSDNLQELLAQVSTVTSAVSEMIDDSVATVESISRLDGADELESAFEESSTCQELGAGG